MKNSAKRKPRKTNVVLSVKGDLRMPREILPWEIELLAEVINAVEETQIADSQAVDTQ